jgi:hypothetical protein
MSTRALMILQVESVSVEHQTGPRSSYKAAESLISHNPAEPLEKAMSTHTDADECMIAWKFCAPSLTLDASCCTTFTIA